MNAQDSQPNEDGSQHLAPLRELLAEMAGFAAMAAPMSLGFVFILSGFLGLR